MLYRPRLSNGKPAPLNWPLALFRLTNIICWPVEDNASRLTYIFDRFLWMLTFVVFAVSNDAAFRYLRKNVNNFDELLTGVPTYMIVVETQLRSFSLGLKKEKYKKLLQKFYTEIYIEQKSNPKLYKSIQRQFVPISVLSFFYLCALSTYIFKPIYMISIGSRELLYKMIMIFDYQPLYIYIPCILGNMWVGFIVTSTMFGEPNVLATLIFHLNGRYILMRENLMANVDQLLKTNVSDDIPWNFRQILVATLEENQKLNKFAREIQVEFSFRVFIICSFMAASLCALGFKVFTSPITSISYIFWSIGKVQETIAFGEMGSSIITITDSISSMYYECKWEAIVERCTDSKANVGVMKLVYVAILMNEKPFYLSGFNFFSVSLSTAVKVNVVFCIIELHYIRILRGASSYFTCLISFR